MRDRAPVHPGEIFLEEFLVPLGLTAQALAEDIGLPVALVEQLARSKTPVTPDIAARLARRFGTTAGFWLNLQASYTALSGPEGVPERAVVRPVEI